MKYFLFCFAISFSTISFSQVNENEIKQRKEEQTKPTNDRIRFFESECGQTPGVIDCNEFLEYDESSNAVYHRKTGKPFTGVCETCHQNGKLERVVNFVGGREDGTDSTFYSNGQLQVVRNHVSGSEDGLWVYYYPDGKKAWEITYSLGTKVGKHTYYFSDGSIKKIENFNKSGRLDGLVQVHYNNKQNQIHREANYKDGLLNGDFTSHFPDGVMMTKQQFDKGEKIGRFEFYYENGQPSAIENYEKGRKEGSFKSFFNDDVQQIRSEEFYRKGKREGVFKYYYDDGKVKKEVVYNKDILVKTTNYDEFGNIVAPEKKKTEEPEEEEKE